MKNQRKILLIEDNVGDAVLIQEMMHTGGPSSPLLTVVQHLQEARDCLDEHDYDLMLLDLMLPDSQGVDTFLRMYETVPRLPIIVLSGVTDEAVALQALKNGAQDYLVKGKFDENVLNRAVQYAIERKQIEEVLREKEEKYRKIFESANDIICYVDTEGVILDVNWRIEQVLGIKPGSLIGKHFLDDEVMEFADTAKARRTFQDLISIESPGEISAQMQDWQLRKVDGTIAYLEASISPLWDSDDKKSLQGLLAVVRDVTKRKETEKALRASERNFREIFEHIPEGFLRFGVNGTIILINPRFVNMIGSSNPDRIQGKNIHALESFKLFPLAEFMQILTEVGEIENFQGILVTESGSLIHIRMNAYAVRDENSTLQYYEGTVENITELKTIEQDLQNSRDQLREFGIHQQELLEQERKNIARYIHDELGQSLTALKMEAYWLQKKLPGELEFAKDKIESMTGLIDKTIQTIKNISAELRPRLLDDLGLVPAIEWQLESFQNRTGIECHLNAHPLPVELSPDCGVTIIRIIQEALTNVARHAQANKVWITLSMDSNEVNLQIRDNGCGITREQANSSKSFGLIGMRERAYSRNGEICISGSPNQGSLIQAWIPLVSPEEIEQDAQPDGEEGHPKQASNSMWME